MANQMADDMGGTNAPPLDADLNARAACLVNPVSGIANDFLNHFNEVLLLVENLPVLLPEMVDELIKWQPVTYIDYFRNSPLPGSVAALRRYEDLTPSARGYFEQLVEQLNERAVGIVTAISAYKAPCGNIAAEDVADLCAQSSRDFREALDLLTSFVNNGQKPLT